MCGSWLEALQGGAGGISPLQLAPSIAGFGRWSGGLFGQCAAARRWGGPNYRPELIQAPAAQGPCRKKKAFKPGTWQNSVVAAATGAPASCGGGALTEQQVPWAIATARRMETADGGDQMLGASDRARGDPVVTRLRPGALLPADPGPLRHPRPSASAWISIIPWSSATRSGIFRPGRGAPGPGRSGFFLSGGYGEVEGSSKRAGALYRVSISGILPDHAEAHGRGSASARPDVSFEIAGMRRRLLRRISLILAMEGRGRERRLSGSCGRRSGVPSVPVCAGMLGLFPRDCRLCVFAYRPLEGPASRFLFRQHCRRSFFFSLLYCRCPVKRFLLEVAQSARAPKRNWPNRLDR